MHLSRNCYNLKLSSYAYLFSNLIMFFVSVVFVSISITLLCWMFHQEKLPSSQNIRQSSKFSDIPPKINGINKYGWKEITMKWYSFILGRTQRRKCKNEWRKKNTKTEASVIHKSKLWISSHECCLISYNNQKHIILFLLVNLTIKLSANLS